MNARTAAPATPFHDGELRVQARLGVRDEIAPWASRVVRPFLPPEHRAFHTALPFLVAAVRDARDRPWATLLAGGEGFVTSPDPEHLRIAARPLPGDALEHSLVPGADVGLLGIEFATRRRNRVNGRISASDASGLEFTVAQSFGNCPQYIHPRSWRRVSPAAHPVAATRSARLTPHQQDWIRRAETLFIASGYRGDGDSRAFGLDASHRGGDPGFVQVPSDTRLVMPDYAGNNHYNTIGNLLMDPRAGLLFVDFERGGMLQLTGHTRIDWDTPAVAEHPGARRLVVFELDEAVELREALPLRFHSDGTVVRSLRLVEKRRESDDVTSFVFAARDGGALADFEPGQHLPIELPVSGHEHPARRTYSLSGAAGGEHYRISVKREAHGLVSRLLHDRLDIGAFVNAGVPAGDFVLKPGHRPVVLLSAGVGLTPLVSMLHALAAPDEPRSGYFIHGARDGEHHPLRSEVRALAAGNDRVHQHVVYSRPRATDREGLDFDARGRLDAKRVLRLLPDPDADFYLCGPADFMAELAGDLDAGGIAADRIHTETFGPRG